MGELKHENDLEHAQIAVQRAAREFLNYLQVERGLSSNTITAYRRALVRYLEYLDENGLQEPDEITRDTVVDFSSSMSSAEGKGLSPRSRAQAISAVRMFHRFMVAEGYAANDPSGSIVTPKMPMKLPKALTRDQVEKLLDVVEVSDERGIRDKLILEMLYATGMRISELVGLDVGDVDIEERLVKCRGKGDKWRIVPFGKRTREVLYRYLRDARPALAVNTRTPALILNAKGGRLTRQGCWKIVKKHAGAAGIEDITSPHVLRHTFATHMLQGGAGLLVVQELLGHASVSTTQIYTDITKGHLKEIYMRSHPRA